MSGYVFKRRPSGPFRLYGWMDELINEWMNERTNEWTNGRTNE